MPNFFIRVGNLGTVLPVDPVFMATPKYNGNGKMSTVDVMLSPCPISYFENFDVQQKMYVSGLGWGLSW